MIKHRTLVHIALNAKGQRVGVLVSAGGRLIPFGGSSLLCCRMNTWRKRSALRWLVMNWDVEASLLNWKWTMKTEREAVRFQRVMLVGD